MVQRDRPARAAASPPPARRTRQPGGRSVAGHRPHRSRSTRAQFHGRTALLASPARTCWHVSGLALASLGTGSGRGIASRMGGGGQRKEVEEAGFGEQGNVGSHAQLVGAAL